MITFICYIYEIQNNLTISGWLYTTGDYGYIFDWAGGWDY